MPQRSPSWPLDPEPVALGGWEMLARSWIIALYGLVRASLAILAAPDDAVDRAFGWLTDADLTLGETPDPDIEVGTA